MKKELIKLELNNFINISKIDFEEHTIKPLNIPKDEVIKFSYSS